MSDSRPESHESDTDAFGSLEESFANAVNAASIQCSPFSPSPEQHVPSPDAGPNTPGHHVLHLGDMSQSSETDDLEVLAAGEGLAHMVSHSPQRELPLTGSPSKLIAPDSIFSSLPEPPSPAFDIGLPGAGGSPPKAAEDRAPRISQAWMDRSSREKRCETKTIEISGRSGVNSFINGTYHMLLELRHDGRPVFLHRDPVPREEDLAGRPLYLYYHVANDAWAVSTELGSLDVLAYAVGDMLQLPRRLPEDLVWIVSNGTGAYEADTAVRVEGTVFVRLSPPAAAAPRASLPADRPVSFPPRASEPSPPNPLASATAAASLDNLDGDMQDDMDDDDRFTPEPPPQSSPSSSTPSTPRSRSKSLSQRARSSIVKKIKKSSASVRDAFDRTKDRLLRMALPETPVAATTRLLDRLRAAQQTQDWAACHGHVAEIQRLVRRPRSARDPLDALRLSLLDVWRTLLLVVDKVNPITYRERFFDTIVAAMVREELHLHSLTTATQRADWVREAANVMSLTHDYVATKLGQPGMYEVLLLFCAKALAINYFCIPGLAHVIVRAIVQGTPIVGRRGRKIGQTMSDSVALALTSLARSVPAEKKFAFESLFRICRVNIGADADQCAATLPASTLRMPSATVHSLGELSDLMAAWHTETAADLSDLFPDEVTEGPWTRRFITEGEAGFAFLSIFLEVLLRRCRTLYQYSAFRSKSDQLLGITETAIVGTVFMPGFTELTVSFLRLALTSERALKQGYRVGAGPPSVVCNWTDRTAACALALSQDGLFLGALARDLMGQTSTSHVIDVMALLGSLKAFLESFDSVHETSLPVSLDITLFEEFVTTLLTCRHYVVVTFALRWLYDCLDYFHPLHRAMLARLLTTDPLLSSTLCHWEPSVASLSQMVLLYRIVDPAAARTRQRLVSALDHLVNANISAAALDDTSSICVDLTGVPAALSVQRTAVQNLRAFVQRMCAAHDPAASSFSAASLRPWTCPDHTGKSCTCRAPAWHTRYAAHSLETLRAALPTAVEWLAASHPGGELYPPLALSIPPLHNATSAYSTRPSPGGATSDAL
eukprot:m.42449 g.42449  ORF g.42449 m.42449 type:complete len:1062 (-) comp10655_c0_seq1:234-3419(-)